MQIELCYESELEREVYVFCITDKLEIYFDRYHLYKRKNKRCLFRVDSIWDRITTRNNNIEKPLVSQFVVADLRAEINRQFTFK